MNYFIECRNVLRKSDLLILNENFEEIGVIQYLNPEEEYFITCKNNETDQEFFVKSNPIKHKSKYIIFNKGKKQIANIKVGVKIIHSIIEAEKYLFVKSAFWKIKYQVYDERNILLTLSIVRKDSKRYYKIESTTKDFLSPFATFLIAQAVRRRVLIK